MNRGPTIELDTHVDIPLLGFGTYKLSGKTCEDAVKYALDVGYRHIDTASRYGNQAIIGEVLSEYDLPREDVFLTSKVWRDNLHADDLYTELDQTLRELQTDYLDLYLVHWPDSDVPIAETLYAMDEALSEGKIRSIGVSNFTSYHLKEALATGVDIVNNQTEFHPTLNQKELLAFCREHEIVVTAYSPLGQGEDVSHDVIVDIAQERDVSASQIILAWLRAKHIVAIPRSANPDHIRDNFASLEVELEWEEVHAIDAINEHNRINVPEYNEFDYSAV